MDSVDDRTGIIQLDRAECLRMLGMDDIGRLAIVQGGTPAVFPLNYALDGEDIVFRTDPGTKLSHGPGGRAAFEIDGLDRVRRKAWSVVATGRLEEITIFDGPVLERVRALDIRPWAPGAKEFWMRLIPDSFTGRRIGPLPPRRTAPVPPDWAGPPGSAGPQ